ncbi:MAG: hypothetical protein M1415_08050 [Firmicutes bacterium]|jgi:hypothetical protein|nr:hypothetical protein [Bacillota bacterium]MCL5063763.1 hypothetical protein [Bacillota bacterium]
MQERQGSDGARRVHNEAVALYDMNADDMLHATGHVVADSSLGTILDPLQAKWRGQLITQEH